MIVQLEEIVGELEDTQKATKRQTDKATKRQTDKATKRQSNKLMTEAMMRSKTCAQEMFQKFESNIISLAFAKNNNDVEKIRELELTEHKIINTLLDGPVQDYNFFMTLFIAEYKDHTYWSLFDAHYEQIECDILAEYSRIFSKNCIWDCMAKSHKHDPNHIMFVGKSYHFYDMLEHKGCNILVMTEDEIYSAI
jgi:hypothetical protein